MATRRTLEELLRSAATDARNQSLTRLHAPHLRAPRSAWMMRWVARNRMVLGLLVAHIIVATVVVVVLTR